MCNQVLKRFDFEKKYKSLTLINPNFIIHGKIDSFFDIIDEFPTFIIEDEKQNIDSEFRELKILDFDNIFNKNKIELLYFWKTISEIKRTDSRQVFPTLTTFVQKILVLPHSSANVERVFSQVNINKTKCRNRLEKESIEGILYSKDYLKLSKCNYFDITIKSDILQMLNSDIYS